MMKDIVTSICIGRIIIGSLLILITLSNFMRIVEAATLQEKIIDHMREKENDEKINSGFVSSLSGVDVFEKYDIRQRMKTEYSHPDRYSSATQFSTSRNVDNEGETLKDDLKTLENLQESGRSFTMIHMFLKTLKKTLKSLRPEIKLSECAQKYFFSTSESETSAKPTHDHGHKKKKKKKHKHDPNKDYSDHITDGVVGSVFGLHSDFADIIYKEYKPYLHIARSVYKSVKSTFEFIRQDALMKCSVEYFIARFCIWVDG